MLLDSECDGDGLVTAVAPTLVWSPSAVRAALSATLTLQDSESDAGGAGAGSAPALICPSGAV